MATFLEIYKQWFDAGYPGTSVSQEWNTEQNIQLLVDWLNLSKADVFIDSGYGFTLEINFTARALTPSIAVDFKSKRVNVFQSGDCIQPNIIQVRPDESGQVSPAAQALLTELELKVLRFVGLDKPTPAE